MRAALISRATLYSSPGGDTRQVEMTAAELRKLGVEADVLLTSDVINYSNYDLLHFFNIIRPADILRHTSRTQLPYLVSTIFVEYSHQPAGSKGPLKATLEKIFGDDGMEYIKVVARRLKNGERIGSTKYLLLGHRRSVRKAAQEAAMLLPNSASEYHRFSQRYHLERPYRVVPNGIDAGALTQVYPDAPAYHDAIISMGRIEPRKNQLNLIRAMNGTGYKLFIHGSPSPNHQTYYDQCKKEAGPNIIIGGYLGGQDLYSAYQSARVHVLPSFFETTGLSSLEAAAMGCNIVITDKGDTRDYFGDHAWYCEPDDISSIRAAVDTAFKAPYDTAFREYILTHYTWQQAAAETLKAYYLVLGGMS